MKITANFKFKNYSYQQVAPHNHREQSKTSNSNIDWSLTRKGVDVLNMHPLDYHTALYKHWAKFQKEHDKRMFKNRHPSRAYGSVNALLAHLARKKKPEIPYKTINFGFGNGRTREAYESIIKKAYPNLKQWQLDKAQSQIMAKFPAQFNARLYDRATNTGIAITDSDIHSDETKNHTGQIHGQGRAALLGLQESGKPSASLSRAIITAFNYDKQDLDLVKKVHPDWNFVAHEYRRRALRDSNGKVIKDENGKTKKHTVTISKPNPKVYLKAFRYVSDRLLFKTFVNGLHQRFPNAHLSFTFHRTNAISVSHDQWIKNQKTKDVQQKNAKVRHQQKQNRADSRHVSYKARENRTKLQKQIKRVKLNMSKSRSAVSRQARHYGSVFSNSAEKSASSATFSNRAKLSQSASYTADSAKDMYSLSASNASVVADVQAGAEEMAYSFSADNDALSTTNLLESSASTKVATYSLSADSELTTTKHRLSSSADDEVDNARNSLSTSAETSASSHIDYAQRSLSMSAKISMSIANSVTNSKVRSKISANSSVASTSALSVANSYHDSYSSSASIVDRNAHTQARNQILSAHNARAKLGNQAHFINSYLGIDDITSTSGSVSWYNFNHSISMATTSAFPAMKQTINSARVLASQSASNSASKAVSSSVEQLSMKSAKVEQAGSSIHKINIQTHNDDTYQGNDGNSHWSFRSTVKTFLNTTANNIQNVVKKCKKKWSEAIQKSKEADRKLKEARRDTVAVHDYHQLLDENDPIQSNGKRKYGGNLFKALLGRYNQATDKYQKRFIKEDVKNTEKAQSDSKHIKQVTEVVNADRKVQSSKPKPKPKMKTKQPKPKQSSSRLRGTFNKNNPYKNGRNGYHSNDYGNNDYQGNKGSGKDKDDGLSK